MCKISLNCDQAIRPATTCAERHLRLQSLHRSRKRKRRCHRESGGAHRKGQIPWCTSGAKRFIRRFQVTYTLGTQAMYMLPSKPLKLLTGYFFSKLPVLSGCVYLIFLNRITFIIFYFFVSLAFMLHCEQAFRKMHSYPFKKCHF